MSFSLFNRTFPFIGLIERQLATLREAAVLLDSVFLDFRELAEKCSRIRALASYSEVAADEVTHQLALTYLKSDERKDIYDLNLALQEAMVAVVDVSTRIGLYGFREIRAAARNLTAALVEMITENERLVANLVAARIDAEHEQKMRRLKEEARMFLLVGLGETYESEPQTPQDVLEVVKWGQIYDRLEEALLAASRLTAIIEGIILKNV